MARQLETEFADRLRAFMAERGLTQVACARLFRLKQPTIHRWLNGGGVRVTVKKRLLKRFPELGD